MAELRSRSPVPTAPSLIVRSARLRSPLLLAVWGLLAVEVAGGLLLFFARLAWAATPGVGLHVAAGLALTVVYAFYQWRHLLRVAPLRVGLHQVLGAIAAASMALTLLSGLWLGLIWWQRTLAAPAAEVHYPALPVAIHNIGNMLVIAFVGAHLSAVLTHHRTREP